MTYSYVPSMTITTNPETLTIPKRIAWARKRVGLSQERLAAQIGTSRRHVIRWENGAHLPGRVYAAKIAAATKQPARLFETLDDEEEEE